MRKYAILIVFALLLPVSEAVPQERTVTVASPVGFSTFDPFLAPAPSIDYLRPVYDSLVIKRGLDRYEPGLTQSFSFDESMKIFRLKLRDGVYFSDGVPLNAQAVKANFEHGRGVKRSSWASVYANIETIETPAADEVILRLKSPDPTLLESLQAMPGMMVSPAALVNPASLAVYPVGVGPWKLDPDHTIIGERHTYIPAQNYWDSSVQQFGNYVLLHISDAAARVNALRNGQLDITPIGPEQAEAIARYGFNVVAPDAIFQVLQIGDAGGEVVPALGDKRVRRAIGMSMDREAILKVLFNNHGVASNNFFPTGVDGFSDRLADMELYNLPRARALMQAAGYGDGFMVDVVVQPQSARVATVVAGELAKIGVVLKITVMPDSGSWLAAYRQRQSPIGVLAQRMTPPYGLWSSFVAETGHYNPFRLKWPEMDRIASRAAGTGDGASKQRRQYYAVLMEKMIADEAILFPISMVELVAAMRPGIHGDVITFSGAGLPNPRLLLIN